MNSTLLAWQLAGEHHADQKYGDDLPYLYHIGQVYFQAMAIARLDEELNAGTLACCAILHDIVEDTGIEHAVLQDNFSTEVYAGVLALSKNEALASKQEQMSDSLDRIKKLSREIAVVKIADRISNLSRTPPSWWDRARIQQYAAEARLINEALAGNSPVATEKLAAAIDDYADRYLVGHPLE